MAEINRARRDSKAFWQKILAAALIVSGIVLSGISLGLLKLEYLLGVSIPVLMAGFGVLANILDPRDRYIITYETHRYYNQSNNMIVTQEEVSDYRYLPKLRRAISEVIRRYSPNSSPQNSRRPSRQPERQQLENQDSTVEIEMAERPAVTFSEQAHDITDNTKSNRPTEQSKLDVV